MIKFVIFGAGETARRALGDLGYNLVDCFITNNKTDDFLEQKPIYEFDYVLNLEKDSIIVIASEKYWEEMEAQLMANGISKYFIYHESDSYCISPYIPGYTIYKRWERVTYNRLLYNKKISRYSKIAIYGSNGYEQYLLCSIAAQLKNGLDGIVGIVDETGEKNGSLIDVPYVSYESIIDKIDCLIVNCKRSESGVFNQFEEHDFLFDVIDLYDADCCEPAFVNEDLKKYKDIHNGKRIWIVGNGPSLRYEDLDVLWENSEICFGFNMVYKAYVNTKWRASYIGLADSDVLYNCKNIKEYVGDVPVFAVDGYLRDTDIRVDGAEYVHLKCMDYGLSYPGFSDDITKGTYWGCTVSYDIGIQFARYMGANEIYLIGMDNSSIGSVTDKRNHFINNYYTQEDIERYKQNKRMADWDKINIAYRKAEIYSRRHGFRIFNATRGGKLEAFERVEFDSIFQKGKK